MMSKIEHAHTSFISKVKNSKEPHLSFLLMNEEKKVDLH